MLFKRIIEGKSVLKADVKTKSVEKCLRRKSECDGCWEHSTILEETMKMVLLGVVLWAGVTFGNIVTPYPFNLLINTDITHPPPLYDYPFLSADVLKVLPPIKPVDTNRSIAISEMAISLLLRLEQNLVNAEIKPNQGTGAQGLAILGQPSDHAMQYEKSSMTITMASQNLVATKCTSYGLADDECASFISTLNLRGTNYGSECAAFELYTCTPNKLSSKYRTFDGSCNHPVRSSWGQALTGYKRLLHPRYFNGIDEPRRAANNNYLPSARLVSTSVTGDMDLPESSKTVALAVWSQFIYHDMVHTPTRRMIHVKSDIRCCDSTGSSLVPRHVHPSCYPIIVPESDPHFKGDYPHCMEYTRSVTTYRGDCTFGAAEQMNQATHFLDGSQIYGSNNRVAASLREKTGGLLKTSTLNDEELLPLATDPAEKCMLSGDSGVCFSTGDVRSNMHPTLASLHTLLVREHNRVARALALLNPKWGSDKLFHEARRIVVAEIQHITYKQWLPAITGLPYEQLYDNHDTGYNPDTDPTISNSFATVAFHFVNSLLDKDVAYVDSQWNKTFYRMKEHFFKPEILARNGQVEGMLRGMVSEQPQQLDLNYEDDLHNNYLGGLDALAIDIQRGRDHGLPGYTQYRTLCGLPHVEDFDGLSDVMDTEKIAKFESVYKNVNDIDLVMGAMAERPVSGSLLGPTLTCLIKEQLRRSLIGDRYFYTHSAESGGFTKTQLREIKKASIAGLLCNNAGFDKVQRDVFAPVSDSNPLVSCSEVKKINLNLWSAN